MSIAEIMPAVESLSRTDQLQLARLSIDRLADDDLLKVTKGQNFSIDTPEFGSDAASQLSRILASDRSPS
jgi:hypothetical protein